MQKCYSKTCYVFLGIIQKAKCVINEDSVIKIDIENMSLRVTASH
jgi:hypothetical protein